jgi:hypothetical protein
VRSQKNRVATEAFAHFSATPRGIFRRNGKQAVARKPAGAATTDRKSNPNMKTLILTAVMFLTVALARPAAADKLTLFSGYIVWTETAQFVGDKILIDGSGDGNSTRGKFSYTFHFDVNPVTGLGRGTAQLTFANGDTWSTASHAFGIFTGLGDVAEVNELHHVKTATGHFAGQVGDFVINRMVDNVTGNSRASFHGKFEKTTP